jgi:hypothetical protein
MSEFYRDDRRELENQTSWGGGSSSGEDHWGVSWGGGGGGSGETNEDSWYLISGWDFSSPEILLNSDGYIQTCGPWLLEGENACMSFNVKAQIKDYSGTYHIACLLLAFSMSEREKSLDNPFDWLFQKVPVLNGRITIQAKWQAGHWNYEEMNTARFKIYTNNEDDAVITPWMKLKLGNPYLDIAVIDIVNGQFILSSLRLT